MKRKGETFTEFLTSATVFGIMMAGLFEFMANQTQSLANIRDRDNLMYGAQVVSSWNISRDVIPLRVYNHNILHNVDHNIKAGNNTSDYEYKNQNTGQDPYFAIPANESPIKHLEEKIVSFDWDKEKHILTVKNNNASMTFSLKPSDTAPSSPTPSPTPGL